jgi:hypothetical protein
MRSNSKQNFVNKKNYMKKTMTDFQPFDQERDASDLPPLFGLLAKLKSLAEMALAQLSRSMEQAACSPVNCAA